ncbi:protein of unknown function [Streptantibioticus cattleyicolor NRRL 8057 = DSM 46488]|nr:protein of unknown function [Streptantibioticus cattleyicolor NRRL 8057 = DSM 46488]
MCSEIVPGHKGRKGYAARIGTRSGLSRRGLAGASLIVRPAAWTRGGAISQARGSGGAAWGIRRSASNCRTAPRSGPGCHRWPCRARSTATTRTWAPWTGWSPASSNCAD